MTEVLQIAGSLGVGAFLGVIIFFMYVKSQKSHEQQVREDRKFMEDRLTDLLEQDQKTRKENTKALTELNTLITRLNGRLK